MCLHLAQWSFFNKFKNILFDLTVQINKKMIFKLLTFKDLK